MSLHGEEMPIMQLGTYISPMPSSISDLSTIERLGLAVYHAEGYSTLHSKMESMYRNLCYTKKISAATFCALIVGLPKRITNLTEMYNELLRLTNALELPSCDVNVNFKYILWRNVISLMIEVFADCLGKELPRDAGKMIIRTALMDIRRIILEQENTSGGHLNIQGSLHVVTRGYACDGPPTERQNRRSDIPSSIVKNNMTDSLMGISSVRKTLDILRIASAISGRGDPSSNSSRNSRDASPTRR